MPTVFFFCDGGGRVAQTHAEEFKDLDLPPGTDLCAALGLDCADAEPLSARFAPKVAHTLTDPAGRPMTLRIIELPESLAPAGGFLVTLRFSAPLSIFRDADLPDNPGPSIATLDYALFNAVFNDARDAILLADEHFSVLAANRKAHTLFATEGGSLTGITLRHILRAGDQARVFASVKALKNGASWRCTIATLGADGQETPVRLKVRRLSVGEVRLFQFMMSDLRGRMALERDLAQSRIAVADMNTALKQVLRNVEEERQELKDELAQQVREEVLPTVERIALEDSPLVRQAYRSALEEKIADMGVTTPDSTSLLSRLTPREMDVCRLIQQGWQGRAIAEELGISFETLQTHRKNIRRKLDLKGGQVSLCAFVQQQPPF
ncbi:MAG: LuxR C-terminal-related transcriptional regulator [Desulfomicrobium sp.]|nr:LuxR C-terminal-related transcriptional regulator [Pseudomonadota bacterium]MBV1713047.1 LuxR C-terminal-related transcriptional regulator [Desulfomicrobium sp.]MBU4572017.1 LuxR C-terminal-related transcriptional regulator [Pseudomonadota bacterium]MBU4596166.1 LuxR C-terminal-related transcriptional regulator [Pseudomonadota bacterium]MBV1721470.1 LuxR C-terminal-related transcriptional regulator [Desulfomicrobium sp.]